MKFGAKILRKIVKDVIDEAPPRTQAEVDHLQNPRTEQARRLLAFIPTLDKLPMEGPLKEFLPAIRLVIENVALDCEEAGDVGAQRRQEIDTWVAAMRNALA